MADNERFPVKLFPTATASDVLFYVTLGRLDKRKIPEYGTSYRDSVPSVEDWPHHKLVHVSAPDGDGRQRWWFAADRENEDIYNWEIGQGTELIRSYLVKRSLYRQRPDSDLELLEGEFTYPTIATLDGAFPNYGFADDTVLEAPDELKSLYIVVKRRLLRPVITETIYDEDLELNLKRSYTIVPTSHTLPANGEGVVYELEPVNTFHSRQVQREVLPKSPGWTLASYFRTQAVRINVPNLPRELLSATVVWNASYSVGTQDQSYHAWKSGVNYSLGKSVTDSANSSASIIPEVQLRFRDIEASNLPANEYEVMIPGDATEAAVISRLNTALGLAPGTLKSWPVFRPESSTITTTGQNVGVKATATVGLGVDISAGGTSGQEMERGSSDDFSVSLSAGAVQIPPCIHGAITLSGVTSQVQRVAATATMSVFLTSVGSNTNTKTKAGIAYGVVSPSVIPAVSGTQTIPTSGLYLMEMVPGRRFMGCQRVIARVLNASTLVS